MTGCDAMPASIEGGFGVPVAAFIFAMTARSSTPRRLRSASTMKRFSRSWAWRSARSLEARFLEARSLEEGLSRLHEISVRRSLATLERLVHIGK
jgi:hypothetical protein